jgi:hypothetical protein
VDEDKHFSSEVLGYYTPVSTRGMLKAVHMSALSISQEETFSQWPGWSVISSMVRTDQKGVILGPIWTRITPRKCPPTFEEAIEP